MCDLLGMYITNVEKEGVFLKVWGQIDKKAAIDVELALFKAYGMYEEGNHLLSPPNIQIGVLCCAKYIDEKYYRARITNDDARCQGSVEVNFIDFGNRDVVPIVNLRSLDCFNATFITLPPLALPFILSEVICTGGEWNDITLEHISRQIRYMEVHYTVVSTHLGYNIIKIYLVNNELASHLVRNNLMTSISLENQEALLSAMIPRNPQIMPPADQSLLQYKSVTLEPNSQHEVYVSYITDGPCHFSVQLKKSEAVLAQLMREINSIPLKTFDELPIPGTVCLAKCMEDSHICRAVITSEVDNQYKLFYVDFGNTEVVPPDNIYQMPFKYIIPKIMAIRLSLKGVDKSTVTLEMQCAFKQFVDNRLLMMEVYPAAKKMSLPKCRMWDPETNTDVMDILNKAAQLAFPNVIALHRGFTRPVKVTFVYSCNKFYIHLKSNEDELNHLMANLQLFCNSSTATYLENPKVDIPCCAQFAFDGQWYRSSIVALNGDSAKVKYIDYGNEEDVPAQSLKNIDGQFLTCMRPQAIECCLNGYQNMSEDVDRDNKLEELILDQEFTMKVIDMVDNKSLVDLIDANGSTVTSLLMDAMINQTKVISNSNIDSTTTKYGSGTAVRNNCKSYDEGFWSSRDKSQKRMDNKSEDWRQDSRKFNGSNENEESWRPKNNKSENEWHDNTSNDSFSRGRKGYGNNRRSPNTKSSNNNWNSSDQDKHYNNRNSYTDTQDNNYNQNNQSEWNSGENNRDRSRNNRSDNEGNGNKENSLNRKKSHNFNDTWNTDNSSKNLGENEEYQGVKRRPKNFSGNNSNNTSRSRADSEEWSHKKNSFNGIDYAEKKSYREKTSYDSDGSYKKGKQDKNFNGKTKYNDGGDYKKKSFRKDNDFNTNDYERTDGKKFNSRNDSKWSDRNEVKRYFNSSYDKPKTVTDPAPEDATFQTIDVIGSQKVTLSWFHNPCSFFCQLMDSQQYFSTMMEEIQETYKDIPASHCSKGAPAIALFPEDNVFYRSRILKNIGNQYKVYYVDFGNISVVDKVWPIDKKYMDLPMQAIPCGLGGIQYVGGAWPEPTAFTNYMQKDYLDCDFLGFEVDRYIVNLSSNGEDIKLQLIQNNLAKYIEPVMPPIDFDINCFAGHTFRAMIDYVVDLSDFALSLKVGIQLLCSAHNLGVATETFVDDLKQKEGQVVIVYCDNVIENRLEVTLYDQTGNKLNILNPDEGAYESIEPVCPYLLMQTKVHGFVSYVNETSIVLQPSDCAEGLDELLNELYEHYNSLSQENTLVPEEGYLYAVCSADANWYRGRVTSFDDDKVTVMYVDYGNTEDVMFSSLRELDPKFYWWDRMAILVNVSVPTAALFDKNIFIEVYFRELGLEGEILEVEGNVPPTQPQPEISTINEKFENSCQISAEPQGKQDVDEIPPENNVEAHQSEYPSDQIDESVFEGTAVIISHIDSPSDFYIQLSDSQNAISELQSKLQYQIETMPVLDNASVGGLCAAPYSVDQMWYRSQILDADEDITTVRFIDYGNTDVIDNKATQIKTLPAEFLALEEYATRCRLKIKPLEEEWSKATTDRFEELVYADSVRVQFINQDEKANYVELLSGDRNVKDILIAENLALIDEGVVMDPKLKGYISHMNSPSEFWVQLDGWCSELEWIAEQLSNAASFSDLEDFTPGSLCAAMFLDDEMWYRARILSNTVAGLEVLFLDYGNSCVCGNLKQLPEHLVMAPPLALKCSLQKPGGLFSWSSEAAQKFSEISADGQTEFTVRKLTTGETSIVELYINDEAISSKLLPITEAVNVTDIQSLNSFSVSKQGVVSDEKYGLEKIPGYEYNREASEKFVEINNEGKTCFGMEIVSDNTIRLYINGNDIRNEFLPILKLKSSEVLTENSDINTEKGESNISPDIHETVQNNPEVIHNQDSENPEIVNDTQTVLASEISEISHALPTAIINQSTEEASERREESVEQSLEVCQDLLAETIHHAIDESHVKEEKECSSSCNIQDETSGEYIVIPEDTTDDIGLICEKDEKAVIEICDIPEKGDNNEEVPNLNDTSQEKEINSSLSKNSDTTDIHREITPVQSTEVESSENHVQLCDTEHTGDENENCKVILNISSSNNASAQESPEEERIPPKIALITKDDESISQLLVIPKDENEVFEVCDNVDNLDNTHLIANEVDTGIEETIPNETTKIWNTLETTQINDTEVTTTSNEIAPVEINTLEDPEISSSFENEEMNIIEAEVPKLCDMLSEELEQKNDTVESSDIYEINGFSQHDSEVSSSEETVSKQKPAGIEFTAKMMTSFSAPTVSQNESLPKLSRIKVTPKSPENSLPAIDDSSKIEE